MQELVIVAIDTCTLACNAKNFAINANSGGGNHSAIAEAIVAINSLTEV